MGGAVQKTQRTASAGMADGGANDSAVEPTQSRPAVDVTLYFIRHGESRHNSASKNLDLGELLLQHDHGLSVHGAGQCVQLAEKLSSAHSATGQDLLADDSCARESSAGVASAGEGGQSGELKQAERKEAAPAHVSCDEADYRRLFHPDTPLTCSSLTRAIQTAALALSPLPSLAAHGLQVLPDAREKGGGGPIFSADCIATGKQQLIPSVCEALRWIARQDEDAKRGPVDLILPPAPKEKKPEAVRLESLARESARELAGKIEAGAVQVHVEQVAEEAKHHNWLVSAMSVLESEANVDHRCTRLLEHLRNLAAAAPSRAAVCVGHSMLFRRIFSKHFSKRARELGGAAAAWDKSEAGKMLQKHVLLNCGMVALDLDSNGAIVESRLLFGTGFRVGWMEPDRALE